MWSIKKIPSNFSNESRKRKTNWSWPLTLIMQKHDHFRLLRHHYSESPVIPLSNDIWYRCVAHGFITLYFLIFYRWSSLGYGFLMPLSTIFQFYWSRYTRKTIPAASHCQTHKLYWIHLNMAGIVHRILIVIGTWAWG
jgi:hypothetical protein